jgi:carbonic anhydrase/acetyltransferase-like protein (isoleucine patch superfamily)
MPIYALADADLEVEDEDAWWVAPGATLIGKIVMKKNASVWFGAVLRGDNEPIIVGENSNVQDLSVCHTDVGAPLTIGDNVTIGHMAMLHGCTIGDNVLIGIKSTVLNRARIAPYTLVGAHALITEGKEFPGGTLLTGSPASVARVLSEDQKRRLDEGALSYVANWRRFKADMRMSGLAQRGG